MAAVSDRVQLIESRQADAATELEAARTRAADSERKARIAEERLEKVRVALFESDMVPIQAELRREIMH